MCPLIYVSDKIEWKSLVSVVTYFDPIVVIRAAAIASPIETLFNIFLVPQAVVTNLALINPLRYRLRCAERNTLLFSI